MQVMRQPGPINKIAPENEAREYEVRVVHNSFGSWTSPHSTHRSWAREGRSGSKVMHRSDGAWPFIVGHKPAFARSKSRSNQITVNDSLIFKLHGMGNSIELPSRLSL